MKKLRILITAVLFITGYTASIAQSTETRELAPFSKIVIEDNAKVSLHMSAVQEVKVESDQLNDTKTRSENGTLRISGHPSKLQIGVTELNMLEISGYGSITADSTITTQNLRLKISGNGKINLPVEVSRLEAGISGVGKIYLSGHAETLDLNISGNGKLHADELIVNKCEVNISGVGKAYVDVKDEAKLNISGTGTFYYKTKPAVFESHISGIGKYGDYSPTDGSDTTSVNVGGKKIIIIDDGEDNDDYDFSDNDKEKFDWATEMKFKHHDKAKSHWSGFEIGFNTLLDESDVPEFMEINSGKSVNVNLNFFSHDFKLYKRYIMFTTGIGLTLNNYRFSSDKTLIADTNIVSAAYDYDKNGVQINYQKNKLAVNYFTVPLLIQFNTNEYLKKSFHIATGILFSYKYNSHLKLVYDDGEKQKSKRQDDFNIDPFRYDATIRLGYQNYTLYASYSISELFRGDSGPELHPLQFGISLSGW